MISVWLVLWDILCVFPVKSDGYHTVRPLQFTTLIDSLASRGTIYSNVKYRIGSMVQ